MESIKKIIQINCKRLLGKDARTENLSEIARQMGVSPTTIQRWKSGENTPEVPNLEALAEVLKIDPMEFFRRLNEPQPTEPMSTIAKRILSIPDDIYDLASKLGANHEVWDIVRGQLQYDIDKIEKTKTEKTKKKQA
jgi:transcriptional regulator with XRE-family HTH domain